MEIHELGMALIVTLSLALLAALLFYATFGLSAIRSVTRRFRKEFSALPTGRSCM
jgi:HAMP domain-containing protein